MRVNKKDNGRRRQSQALVTLAIFLSNITLNKKNCLNFSSKCTIYSGKCGKVRIKILKDPVRTILLKPRVIVTFINFRSKKEVFIFLYFEI
jgi:hypothetical protein